MLRNLIPDKLVAQPVERDGRRGLRFTGDLAVGSLLPIEVYQALEAGTSALTRQS